MAIKERVVLVDEYSSKAKKIEQSTSAMGDAMKKIKGTASTMGAALKSAFDRSYTVRLDEIGGSYLENKTSQLQKKLDKLNSKKYKVGVDTKAKGISETKSKLESLKNYVDSFKSKPLNIRTKSEGISETKTKLSTLRSLLNKPYKAKFSQSGADEVKNAISKLKSNLSSISKGDYQVKVTGKISRIDKVKSNLNALKSQVTNLSNKAVRFKTDISAIRNARKEAKTLEKQLKNVTGKKHKVKVDLDKSSGLTRFLGGGLKDKLGAIGGGIKGGFSKIGGFFSKLNPIKAFKGRGGGSGGGGSGGMSMLKSVVGGNLITGAITKGIGAVSNMASSTIGAGMDRLTNIQSAKARLRGQTNMDGSRKFSEGQIKDISKSAMNAVTGTAYGFGDAMSVASSAIAAGVDTKNINGYLKDIANISAATGSDFNDIGAIMNKITTTGKLQGDELMQLSDRGLPMLAKIAEMKGVDQETAREMVSRGEISADDAIKAASMAAGNSAAEMNKTWDSAKMNFGSALSKLGAGLLGGSDGEEGGIFAAMTPALLKINDILNGLIPTFQAVGDKISEFAGAGFDKLKEGFGKITEFLQPAIDKFKEGFSNITEKIGEVIEPLKEKLSGAFETLKEAFAPVIEAFSNLLGERMGTSFDMLSGIIDILVGAFELLADIIIALTPVWELLSSFLTGVVIPAFTDLATWTGDVLVPKIVELADTVGGWVKEAFEFIGNAVNAAKGAFDNLVGAVGAAAEALFGLPGKIAGMVGDAVGSAWGSIKSFFGGKGHATGTQYFSGGLTRINERGEEMIQLARGDKIYPADKTDRIIKNEVKNTKTVNKPADNRSVVINVNGANMTNKDVGLAISNELRRLGVVV